jgi:acyl carrier protein
VGGLTDVERAVNTTELRTVVEDAVRHIAPDIDPTALAPGSDLREDLEIDSMDFLNLMDELHARLGVEIPEHDYPAVTTIDGCVDYLQSRLGG